MVILDKYNITNINQWEKYDNYNTYHNGDERLFIANGSEWPTVHTLLRSDVFNQEGILINYE